MTQATPLLRPLTAIPAPETVHLRGAISGLVALSCATTLEREAANGRPLVTDQQDEGAQSEDVGDAHCDCAHEVA
jgi:hypothetical protein